MTAALEVMDSPSSMPIPYSIDPTSFVAAELNRLAGCIPTATLIGRTTVHANMSAGSLSPEGIVARQEAVAELSGNEELRGTLAAAVGRYGEFEQDTVRFPKQNAIGANDYRNMRRGARALQGLEKDAKGLSDQIESPLLAETLKRIGAFNDTDTASLMRGPVMFTPVGLRSRERAGLLPRLRFYPGFSGRLVAPSVGAVAAARYGIVPQAVGEMLPIVTIMASLYGNMPGHGGYTMKSGVFNYPFVYKPLQRRIAQTQEYPDALGAVGALDALLGLAGLKRTMEANGHSTVFPDVDAAALYHLEGEQVKNPLLTLEPNRPVVANDITLGGPEKRLTFLTGPNSGGKSTLAKTVIQSQVLAMVGGAVPAARLHTAIADTVALHTPSAPDLTEESGRFGFELKRVRSILDAASPRSLTVLDDCLDGTTHAERIAVLKNVMLLFRHIGGATLFSTHAHELVSEFAANDEGQFHQVEFANGRPTYRLLGGISTTSHANEVAEQYGFGVAQVRSRLEDMGVQPPTWL